MANATSRTDSDIDLALLSATSISAWDLWQISQRLASELHHEVDLVNLATASTVMRLQIITNGQCLFEKDRMHRELFEDQVLSAYVRLNDERRFILEDIKKRGSIYG